MPNFWKDITGGRQSYSISQGLFRWGAGLPPAPFGNQTTVWASVAAGGSTGALAIGLNGTLWAWGFNFSGALGLGDTIYLPSPIQVGSSTDWAVVAKSIYYSSTFARAAAIKTDGSLWSWGKGTLGVLGLGNTVDYSSPVQVGALTDWARISLGDSSSAAIKTDGSLWVWGRNSSGQLGLGDTTTRSSPVQVGALTDWKMVASGFSDRRMAIKTNGSLWKWGYGISSPTQVGASTDWAFAAIGWDTAFAIKTNGTLWGYGGNYFGQLGLGDTTTRYALTQVGSLTDWATVDAGSKKRTTALKKDGTLWAWGANQYGELGLGDTISRSFPTQVGIGTSWLKISAGQYTTLGIFSI